MVELFSLPETKAGSLDFHLDFSMFVKHDYGHTGADNAVRQQAEAMECLYDGVRKVLADGNCLLRAVGFAFIEWCVGTGTG